ncbi:hypothetical protein BDU57DRAFT_317964 [Ampelomyces quisqualis]|uniref:Uncharacterized protein n=1 Tax=Ampelomyces quisqualis TaxID=50730 RepID=A0A6A5QE52_AMPQU|nr:hypothetical protein BDU57DRAFT_317964 [Ampelomyces quisqualis]
MGDLDGLLRGSVGWARSWRRALRAGNPCLDCAVQWHRRLPSPSRLISSFPHLRAPLPTARLRVRSRLSVRRNALPSPITLAPRLGFQAHSAAVLPVNWLPRPTAALPRPLPRPLGPVEPQVCEASKASFRPLLINTYTDHAVITFTLHMARHLCLLLASHFVFV